MLVQVGADWDKDKCVIAWRIHGKEHHGRVLRNRESVEAFVERLQDGLEADDALELEVGIESGDSFWFVLWGGAGAKVLVFDGKKAHNYMKSLVSSGARDDLRSAKALLAILESADHRQNANRVLSPELKALMIGLATKNEATQEVTKLQNRFGAFLRQYHPALPSDGKILRAQWFLNTIELAPTAVAWSKLGAGERKQVLKGSREITRADIVKRLGQDLGAVDPVEEEIVRVRVRGVVMMLRMALQAETMANTALEALLTKQDVMQQARQIDGIGEVITAGLAIAFGTAEAKSSSKSGSGRDSAAVILGAAPVTQRSGTMGDASPKAALRRSTNPMLRAIPYMLGLQLTMRHPWAKAAFKYYKARGKSTATAFRSITRSFLRVVRAMVRDQVGFDEVRYIEALKAKGVPWALAL